MVWFKSCPRCHNGDVALQNDLYGWFLQCLQCSYIRDVESPAVAEHVLRQLLQGERQKELVAKSA